MKTFIKKTVILLLLTFLLVPLTAHAEESPNFRDVGGTFWAKDAITSLVQLGIVKGFEDNTFKPDAPVTREQFAQLITLSFYLDLPSDGVQTFMDVSPDRWSFTAVEAAKEFLTGYYTPSGKAFFDPTGKATREDVAVALVKTLGYQPDDLQNENILDYYYDSDEISPNIRTYLALAVEKKLLSGYSNGTIQPANPVTRAEAAALLYRVLKSASGDSKATLALNVDAPATVNSPTFYITGDVTKGATVHINNQEVEVVQGKFRVAVQLKEEGTYTYTIVARMPGGKTETVTKTVKFEKGAPELTVSGVPEVTNKQKITVSWKVTDPNDSSPVVYVNDKPVYYSTSQEISLTEGENIIRVRAENEFGKSTEVVKRVIFQTDGPVLTVTPLPETVNKKSIEVSWRVQDTNDSDPAVYVNDKRMYYTTSTTVQLTEGLNTIVVKAVNKFGKVAEVTKTVNFVSAGPVLKVMPLPESTTKKSVTVSWTVSDQNDSDPTVFVNGKQQYYTTSTTVNLSVGANTITVKATNYLGQVVEESYTVDFDPPAPVLTLGYAPETTSSSTITLSWTVTDENDSDPAVYVNDKIVYYSSSKDVTLTPGENVFKIVASNAYGKTSEVTYKVTYTP